MARVWLKMQSAKQKNKHRILGSLGKVLRVILFGTHGSYPNFCCVLRKSFSVAPRIAPNATHIGHKLASSSVAVAFKAILEFESGLRIAE
jgi:hypothetical protein